MFATPSEAIDYAMRASKIMVHRFVDDLKSSDFEFQPAPGANCVAWILGHLALTDRRSLAWLGVSDLPELPSGFDEMFPKTGQKAGVQSGFGDPKAIVAAFDAHRDRLIAALKAVDPAKFLEPPSFQSPMFSDKGEGYLFMGLHTAMHMGQVSAIRRSLGHAPLA